jgi:hypothetical protein
MFSLSSLYNKNGLPRGLIEVHDILLKDTVEYFENGKGVRKGIKEAQKAIKKSLKLSKKRKINTLEPIEDARQVLDDLRDEVEFESQVLKATFVHMEKTLGQILEERIQEPLTLMENARELCRKKEFKKAGELLRESQAKMEKKELGKTRTAILGGLLNEMKELRSEIEDLKEKK